MNKIIFFLAVILFFPCQLLAGDCVFVVDDDVNSICAKSKYWPAYTSADVVISLEQYFSGVKPNIDGLEFAFINDRFYVCGSKERNILLKTLRKIQSKCPKANEEHICTFIKSKKLKSQD